MGTTNMPFDPVMAKQWMGEIVMLAAISAVVSEGVSWLLIYRKESYQTLVENLEREQKKLDKWKEDEGVVSSKSGKGDKSKKIKTKDANVKRMHQQLQVIKMSSHLVMGLMMIVFGALSSMYDAKVVAKLPFVPISFVQSLSH